MVNYTVGKLWQESNRSRRW